jgi:hypothetical protein
MGSIRGSPTKAQPSPGKGPSQLEGARTKYLLEDYKDKLYYKRALVRGDNPLDLDFFKSRGVATFSSLFDGHVDTLGDLGEWFLPYLEEKLLHPKYAEPTYQGVGREDKVMEQVSRSTFFEVQPGVFENEQYSPVCLTWDSGKVEEAKGFHVSEEGYLVVNVGWTEQKPRPTPKLPSRPTSRAKPQTQGKWNKKQPVPFYVHQLVAFLACGPIPQAAPQDPNQASSSNAPLEKLETLHSCDNRSCLAPAHLLRGTHKENMRAEYAKALGERKRFLNSRVDVVGVGC